MNFFKKLCYGFILFGSLWACNPEEEDKTYEVFADVFIKTKVLNNDTVHAVVYSTVSYSKMKSVVVKTPLDEEMELESTHPSRLVFAKEPTDEEYAAEIPEIGRYNFEIIFDNNDEESESNSLSEKYVFPPEILNLEYDKENYEVYFKFGNVEGADAYLLKVFSGGENIFSYPPLVFDPAEESHELSISVEGFDEYIPGELVFEIAAVLYENISNPVLLQAYGGSARTLTIE